MSAEVPVEDEQPMAVAERVLLDNRRTPCAVGLIKAARRMAELESGTILEIWSRDRFAPMEIPIWAERDGHLATQLPRRGRWPRGYYVFEVVKDGLPA